MQILDNDEIWSAEDFQEFKEVQYKSHRRLPVALNYLFNRQNQQILRHTGYTSH